MKNLLVILMLTLSGATMASCYDAYYTKMIGGNSANDAIVEKGKAVFAAGLGGSTVGSGVLLTGVQLENEALIHMGAGMFFSGAITGLVAGAVAYIAQESEEQELLILSIAKFAGADSDMGGHRKTLARLNSLIKKVQKKNPENGMGEVLEQIRIGFDDEIFCRNPSAPYSWSAIKDYVLRHLK